MPRDGAPRARKCAVTKAYEVLNDRDKGLFKLLVLDSTASGGYLANLLSAAMRRMGREIVIDHMAVDHFRRKLRTGKAIL